MDKDEKMIFNVGDYEFISQLIDEEIDSMNWTKISKLMKLKSKIHNVLVSEGSDNEINDVIAKKWNIKYIGTKDGIHQVQISRKQEE